MTIPRRTILLSLVALAGCVPQGPPFASAAATIPPLPQGVARIFFYRWLEPYESITPTTAYLNGEAVGIAEPGAAAYRDVAPGQYLISVQSQGVFPDQFKTVVLKPGDTIYARIESIQTWWPCGGGGGKGGGGGTEGCADTFVVVIMDPAVARYEMSDLRFIQG
jgi:hypothetical protein